MRDFAAHLLADRRLVILRLLRESGGELNDSAIEKGLLMLGHRAGVHRDAVREDLQFLAEPARACVEIELFGVGEPIMIAAITKFGVAVAEGRAVVDGVAQPSLGR